MMKNTFTCLFLIVFAVSLFPTSAFAQDEPSYKNRIGINALGIPAENLVLGYEHSFANRGMWLGLEHRLNQLSEEKDQQVNSIALEYRYYFFSEADLASGLFAGLYAKYRWGEEATMSGNPVQHSYTVLFSGLNAGYRYNYKRLALSAFLGYGLPLTSTEVTDQAEATHALNETYKNDFRIGLTIGLAF